MKLHTHNIYETDIVTAPSSVGSGKLVGRYTSRPRHPSCDIVIVVIVFLAGSVNECWWLTIRLSNPCGDCFSWDCGVPGPKHSRLLERPLITSLTDASQMSYIYIDVSENLGTPNHPF